MARMISHHQSPAPKHPQPQLQLPSQPLALPQCHSLDRPLQLGSTSPMSACQRLPSELLVEIFSWLPALYHSPDRLSVCTVCRSWKVPAQIVLWRSLWLRSCASVSSLAETVLEKPELARLPRALHFSTDEDEYLATLDPDAVFTTMEGLINLEYFHVLVNYCMGDLYDSICEELQAAPIKHVVLGADEGISRSHVQASMRFPALQYLELLRLGTLGDLSTLELEWVYPRSLVELVLVQPDLPGDDLRFLLSHVKGTLRRLRIDFGHLVPDTSEEGTTRLTEEDLSNSLLESGTDLQYLELDWPCCTMPFMNEAIKGLFCLEEFVTSGPTCDPGLIDLHCQSHLKKMTFDLKAASEPPKSLERLVESSARRSNLKTYHVRTFFEDPSWEKSVPQMVASIRDRQIDREPWPTEAVDLWRELATNLAKSGITIVADFL